MSAPSGQSVFDRNRDPHYLAHLVALNGTQSVIASQDIYNQFGVLLIAKGAPVDRRVSAQLNQHRLTQPLDRQVEVDRTLSKRDLLDDLFSLIASQGEYSAIQSIHDFDVGLNDLCMSSTLSLTLRQRLTVLKSRLPEEYRHALFCAWMSGLIARLMEIPREQAIEVFTSALLHDLGILHLDPDLLRPDQTMNSYRWKALQSHVLIGKMLVEEQGCYSPAVAAGVAEHHERMDRSGYPSRKAPEQLGLYGQIIGCADLIHKLSCNELSRQGQSLTACLSHLKVNHKAFRDDVYTAVFKLLSRVEHQKLQGPVPSEIDRRILSVNQQLNRLMEALKSLSLLPSFSAPRVHNSSVRRLSTMIMTTFRSAGLESELFQWSSDHALDNPDSDDLDALMEMDTVQYELLWLYKRLGWGLEELLDKPDLFDSETRQAVVDFCRLLDSHLDTAWALYSEPRSG